MTRHLILHIGSPKCGSTYFQKVLKNNAETLRAAGVNYPISADEGHPGNGADLARLTAEELEAYFAGGDTVILSHEDLFAAGGQMAATAQVIAASGAKVTVLAFLRPFSEFIFGDYSQFIKQNLEPYIAAGQAFEGRSFERFAVDRSRVLAPVGYFRAWRRALPDSDFRLAGHKRIRPVLQPFLNDAELDWKVHRDESNPSLRMADCDEVVAAINAGAKPSTVRTIFNTGMLKTMLPDPGKTPERVAWIEALFYKQNDEIAADFGFENHKVSG